MHIYKNILLAALAFAISTSFSRAASIVWTGTSGGNWSDTNNWNPNQVPGASDVAVITNAGTYSVTLDVNPTIGGMILGTAVSGNIQLTVTNGQTFTLTGTAQVGTNGQFNLNGGVLGGNILLNGALNCSGGTLSGGLTVNSNSLLNVVSSGAILNSFTPGSSVLTNYGTVSWTGGDIVCDYSPQVWNYGLWNAQSDNTFAGQLNGGGGNGVFNNYGTFRKSGGSGTTTFDADAVFNGSGAVDVQSGTVSIQRGLANGTVNTVGGSFFSVGNNVVFSGSTLFTGAGSVEGLLVGSGAVFSGTINFSGVTLSGAITLATNSIVNLGTLNTILNSYYGGVGILTNYGTVNWTGGDFDCDNAPQIYNYGLWNAQSDNTFSGASSSGISTFNNYGTFRKSAASGTTTLDFNTIFTSSGSMDVQSGTVSINRGQAGGAASIAGGATLSLGNNFVFAGGTTFSGTGIVSGLLNGNNALLGGTLNCSGATLSGTVTIVTNGVLSLGTLNVNLDGVTLTNYGAANWIGGDLECNNSPQVWNYGLWSAQSDNTFVGEVNGGNGKGLFNNYGTFRKSGGSGTTSLDADSTFNSYGTVDVESGTVGIYAGQISGTITNAVGAALALDHLAVFNGNTLFGGAGKVSGYLLGNNALFGGTLNCSGVTISGAITLATNSLVSLGTLSLSFNNGYNNTAILTNYGTVNWSSDINCDGSPQIYNYGLWNAQSDSTIYGQQSFGHAAFNNYGTFRKSAASGTTTLDFNTIFTSSGSMDVQSGTVSILGSHTLTGGTLNFGINSSNNFGRITFNGAVALAGTLSVNLNNAYTPTNGVSFALLTYGSESGAFTNLNLPVLQGSFWTNNYGATAFSLTVTSIVPPVVSSSSISHAAGNFSFSWGAVSGQVYQVQFTTNLVPANWVNLGAPVTATNSTLSVSDAIGANPQRFYRVVLP